jgi:hypothetical protein
MVEHKKGGIHLLYHMRSVLFGICPSKHKILPAPPRESLNVFGGPLSIREFRKSFLNIFAKYELLRLPVAYIPYEIVRNHQKFSNSNKIDTTGIVIDKNALIKTLQNPACQTNKSENEPLNKKIVGNNNLKNLLLKK